MREAAKAATVSEDARAEELSLAAWRALARALPDS